MQPQQSYGQPSAVPGFGAQPAGQAANPFGQPAVPAFSMAAAQQQQAQPGTGNGGMRQGQRPECSAVFAFNVKHIAMASGLVTLVREDSPLSQQYLASAICTVLLPCLLV